ncbi:Ferric reduction oxidase [Thalictrum thalictroides]|uniref:Ferric reduction oxidase n=1 Tax=Thalictrum thalictroides TaxID=46969 RepID=A0A7J6WMX2_THATH|nr:Ferric reduction oxidase [Thalictrum thalictroides]
MTASAVVFKKKNRNAMEAKQIQVMDAPSPTTSPGSWFHNADRELESLPQQSLVKATNLHYGSRPDLKKILFEVEGSSVGALVSGPKQMRPFVHLVWQTIYISSQSALVGDLTVQIRLYKYCIYVHYGPRLK